jgi:hypothetical protein
VYIKEITQQSKYMKNKVLCICFLFLSATFFSQGYKVVVEKNDLGMKLVVDGKDFMINGMNWDYFPIGTNYEYSLWKQPEELIKAALDAEMGLLKNMGVNTIRVYTGMQPKWITYIYETFGIYTMLNHSFGRYGLTINGVSIPVTDYADAKTKKLLLSEVSEMANEYKNTSGLLLYLLGNENNYGLFWAGAETEDFPEEEEKIKFIGENRGRPMYKLMNDAALALKAINKNVPVAICNGDLLFAEIVAEECKNIDIYGTNMYRGKSFTDAFERVKKELNMPILFTEFGADAFNSVTNQEDQKMQAFYMVENWKEIYQNVYGLGKVGNSIGGFTFQFSDGWWKYGQIENLDVQDNNASWFNEGYYLDIEGSQNNMNEEWFGICEKGPTNTKGLYKLYPRAAYYALKEAHSISPFSKGVSIASVSKHFSNISLISGVLKARDAKAVMLSNTETCYAARAGELLSNSGFELGESCWYFLKENGGKISISTTVANGGSNSVQIQGELFNNVGIKQERFAVGSIQPNTTYTVTFDIISSGEFGEGGVFKAFIFSEEANGENVGSIKHVLTEDTTSISSTSWESKTYTFTTSADASKVEGGISFLAELVNSTATINIDNVVVKETP